MDRRLVETIQCRNCSKLQEVYVYLLVLYLEFISVSLACCINTVRFGYHARFKLIGVQVTNKCVECSTVFSEAYFCQHCRLFDDKDKQQFHCDQCTICRWHMTSMPLVSTCYHMLSYRVGGRDNYFHCSKCNLCWLTSFREAHKV